MKYKIPGTFNMYIDRELRISSDDINTTTLGSDDLVSITMYDQTRLVKRSWIYWMARYGIDLPVGKRRSIFSFRFYEVPLHKTMLMDRMLVSIAHPITYIIDDVLYKTIPRHPMYAISETGVLYDLKANRISINKITKVAKSVYPAIKLDVGLNVNRYRGVHRLVAMAWCENDDYSCNFVVNHIDGDKSNYHAKNLEWISIQANNKHAVNANLRDDNINVQTLNLDTRKVVEHASITDAMVHIGRSRLTTTITKMIYGRIWVGSNGKFEMRYSSDMKPWASDVDTKLLIDSTNRYRYHITVGDVKVSVYRREDLVGYVSDEMLELVSKTEFTRALARLARTIPNFSYTIESLYPDNETTNYICKNLKSSEIILLDTRKEIMELTGGTKSAIQKSIITNGEYTVNDWVVKHNNNVAWAPLAEIKNNPVSIKLTDGDGVVTHYTSLRKLSDFMGVTRKTIGKALLHKNGVYGDYTIEIN